MILAGGRLLRTATDGRFRGKNVIVILAGVEKRESHNCTLHVVCIHDQTWTTHPMNATSQTHGRCANAAHGCCMWQFAWAAVENQNNVFEKASCCLFRLNAEGSQNCILSS